MYTASLELSWSFGGSAILRLKFGGFYFLLKPDLGLVIFVFRYGPNLFVSLEFVIFVVRVFGHLVTTSRSDV